MHNDEAKCDIAKPPAGQNQEQSSDGTWVGPRLAALTNSA